VLKYTVQLTKSHVISQSVFQPQKDANKTACEQCCVSLRKVLQCSLVIWKNPRDESIYSESHMYVSINYVKLILSENKQQLSVIVWALLFIIIKYFLCSLQH